MQVLNAADGSWARTPEAKAALLSETFLRKSNLPEATENEYSALLPGACPVPETFLPVRKRDARRELQKLNNAIR